MKSNVVLFAIAHSSDEKLQQLENDLKKRNLFDGRLSFQRTQVTRQLLLEVPHDDYEKLGQSHPDVTAIEKKLEQDKFEKDSKTIHPRRAEYGHWHKPEKGDAGTTSSHESNAKTSNDHESSAETAGSQQSDSLTDENYPSDSVQKRGFRTLLTIRELNEARDVKSKKK
ncbi:MAG: hypothetical protein Q9162_006335 [Coniocarpon cinnabarinum]